MKKRLFLLHSWLGLIAGLGLIVIGLTGSVLVFKGEIDGVLAPELTRTENGGKPRLAPDAFLAAVRSHLPGYDVTGWDTATEEGRADEVYVTSEAAPEGKRVYVDGSTGKPLGEPLAFNGTVTNWLLDLHYAFLAGHTGEFITGILAAMLCALGITGVWLYRNFWKTFFQLRWGRSGRIFFSDLHKMVGISSTIFNLILGFTGAWWNLSHIIGHLFEDEEAAEEAVVAPSFVSKLSLDSLLLEAQKKIPGFELRYVGLPSAPDGEIAYYGSVVGQHLLRSPYGSSVSFHPESGEVISAVDIREGTLWEQFLDSFRPLHFGNFAGLPVKILWCLGGMAPGILAISGATMYFKRKRPARRKQSRSSGSSAAA